MIPRKHSILIRVEQDEKEGAQVEIYIDGEEHVLAAAVAGLFQTEDKLLRIVTAAMSAIKENAVKTYPEKPTK